LFTTPDMEATLRHDTIDAAARSEHRCSGRPLPRLGIVDLVHGSLVALESAPQPTTDYMRLAIDGSRRDVIALTWQIGKLFPGICLWIVDREFVAIRWTTARDVESTIDHRDGARASLGGHSCLLDPFAELGIERVHRVDVTVFPRGLGLA